MLVPHFFSFFRGYDEGAWAGGGNRRGHSYAFNLQFDSLIVLSDGTKGVVRFLLFFRSWFSGF